MFFSSHKKQGKEVGLSIKQTLEMGLNNADAIISGDRKQIPSVAFIDPYVAGYIINFTITSMALVYKGAKWGNNKRNEFIYHAWKEIGISGENIPMYFKVMALPEAQAAWDKGGQFSQGSEAAALTFGAAYGILNAEDQKKVLVRLAKVNASRIHKNVSQEVNNSELSAALLELTIYKHIRKNYFGHE